MRKKYFLFIIFFLTIILGWLYSGKWSKPKQLCFTTKSSEFEKVKETVNSYLEEQQESIPEIVDIIADDLKITALCKDGSVWSWEKDQSEDSAIQIDNLKNIKKILYAGPAMYALSEDGRIFAWGSNEWRQIRADEATDKKLFMKAEQIFGLNNIVDIDVSIDYDSSRAKLFAVDENGDLYVCGLYLYWDEEKDYKLGFPEEDAQLVQGINNLFAGAGNFHYFIRKDGTVFSIMDNSIWKDNSINDFIFPQFPIEPDKLDTDKLPLFLEDFPYVDLREGTKYGTTILYELGQDKHIKCIDADKYTVFVAKEDGTLWYWNSKMIDYHDCKDALADAENCQEDYSGYWEKVNIKEILNVTDETVGVPYVVAMCAESENVLFLTNDGQVFMSKYVISEVKDIEYYNQENTNPDRERIKVVRDFPLKTIAFQKLDWENITHINSNGLYCFSAVDESGRYFSQDNLAEIDEEKCEKIDFISAHHLLNQNLFEKSLAQWFDDSLEQEIFLYSENVKGEFVEVRNEDSIFPKELIITLEKMIYQSLDSTLHKITWEETQQSIYFNTIRKLGAKEFELNLEEMNDLFPAILKNSDVESVYDAYKLISGEENCEEIFHFQMANDQDNYLLVVNSGGSAGTVNVRLTRRVEDEFILISEFQTSNSGYGRVIRFDNDFYYVFLEYNYNLKNYDGVRIYKLGSNSEKENLKIKYLPESYIWKNIYNTSEEIELNSYIENIKAELTSDKYLENGKMEEAEVFYGDEEEAEGFIVPANEELYFSNEYYMIDFANMGVPVYMRKSSFIPSSYRDIWHLRSSFYLQNPEDDSITELDKLEIGYSATGMGKPALVQMWFKEIKGQIYTCCLYHVSDYNYVLNIFLLEGEKITRIRTDMICPKRHFNIFYNDNYFFI